MKHLRLLILEDNPDDAELIQTTLRRAGMKFDIKLVSSREAFTEALDSFVPEFILSDHQLPQFISSEALEISRKKLPDVPFILVTGTVSEEFAVEIIKAGADDYILKDRMSRLPLAIETALKNRKAQKEISDYRYALDETAIVAITDQKGIILYANENFCKISKYNAAELIGKDHRIINSGYHPASYIKDLWVRVANGKIWRGEFRNRAKDGTLYWVDTTIIPFLGANGKPYQYLAIRIDITERKIMQEQLIEREKQLDLFISHSPAALAMFDNEMHYVAVSERWISDYKLEGRDLLGESHYDIFPDLPGHWKEIHQRCLAGSTEKNEEDFFIHPDGRRTWLRWEVHPWRRASGEIGGIIIFSEDISKRKAAELHIRESEEKYRTLFFRSPLPKWIYELDTLRFLEVNDAAIELYGYSREEFLNMTIRDIRPPEELPRLLEDIKKVAAEADSRRGLWRHRKKNGEIIIVETLAHSLNFENRHTRMVIAMDITEKLKKEQEILQTQMRLREAQAIAHISNWEIDMLQDSITWSDEFYRIFGLDQDTAVPSRELFINCIHPEDRAFAQAQIEEAFEQITDSSFEFRFIKGDAELRYGYVQWKFEFDREGKPQRLFGILQDITERKEAEQHLKALEDQMTEQKIQEQKEIARAIITGQEKERVNIGKELHDNINQILAGTKLFLSVAAKRNEELKEIVHYPMELLDRSIEEIRLLSHQLVPPLKHIDLDEQVKDLLLKLEFGQHIDTELVYSIPAGLLEPELKLNIYRILQEQVNNIIKYAEAKQVTVEMRAQDGHIDIAITDDGKGFDSTARREGIGISNIINRAESFNGQVQIKSSPGKGCRIEVTIPY